jgi:hypothetical protein
VVTRVKLPVAIADTLPKIALAPTAGLASDRGITITLAAPTVRVAVIVPLTSTFSPWLTPVNVESAGLAEVAEVCSP